MQLISSFYKYLTSIGTALFIFFVVNFLIFKQPLSNRSLKKNYYITLTMLLKQTLNPISIDFVRKIRFFFVLNNCFNINNILQQVRNMIEVKKLFSSLFSVFLQVIGFIPATIYSYVYSEFFTKYTYRLIGERNKGNIKVKNVLDIGTATGGPLKTIVDVFDHARVLGIDYNPLYIPACQKLFKDYENVEIKFMNFYDLEKEEPETMFDIIIFGSSFMILPDQTKAIEVAQRKLNRGGKIYFLLTLYDEKTFTNKILEIVKPLLKYLCTVDFGKVTYKPEFEDFLIGHELKINFSQRLYGNVFLKMAKFYMYEAIK